MDGLLHVGPLVVEGDDVPWGPDHIGDVGRVVVPGGAPEALGILDVDEVIALIDEPGVEVYIDFVGWYRNYV